MNTRIALTSAILVAAVAGAHAQGNFAAFTDHGNVTFTRALSASGYTLTGAGLFDGFELNGSTYDGVAFLMTSAALDSSATLTNNAVVLGPTSFTFTKGTSTLLSVTFQTGWLTGSGPGTGGTFSAWDGQVDPATGDPVVDNVMFGGDMIQSSNINDDSFSFSLANTGTAGVKTAAFGASGSVEAVPEPATMAALGLGVVAFARKRRRA